MVEYWNRLQSRERGLIVAAAFLMVLLALWIFVWEPMQGSQRSLREQLAQQQALGDWLDRIEPEVQRLRSGSRVERSFKGRTALSVIDQSARAGGLAGALQRIEPGSGDQVRAIYEQAAFPTLMEWLEDLVDQRPLAVDTFSADRTDTGRVDSVVVLRRTDR